MKNFIKKAITFVLLNLILVLFIFYFFADGYITDYKKLSGPKYENIIIGTSRASQGIIPSIIVKKTNIIYYNFAFNLSESPFGEIYNRVIKQKIKRTENNNFIVCVSPLDLSQKDNYSFIEKEKNGYLYGLKKSHGIYNINYNLLYEHPEIINEILFLGINKRINKFMINNKNKLINFVSNEKIPNGYSYICNDGSLKISLKSYNIEYLEKRKKITLNHYYKNYSNRVLSKIRINKFIELLEYLKSFGNVIVLRLPVSKEMLELENSIFPEFNSKIEKIVYKQDIKYYDFTQNNKQYKFNDGNHLTRESAIKFTYILADSLKLYQR